MAITKLDIALAAIGLVILQRLLAPKKKSNLPPGPPGLPLLGNAADMPTKKEWETYAEWGRKYGGILSVQVMGRPIIIVNSYNIMQELDKKGSIYSDRPKLEMGGELLGYNETLVLIPYGTRFRTYRKHFSNFLGPQPIEKQKLLIEHETHRFLKRQLAQPAQLMDNLRKLAGGVILGITYGIRVQEDRDPFVDLIEGANANFSAATIPGAYLVDFFPSLKTLPEWLPGMGFMEKARVWAKDTAAMVDVPYNYTKKQMASGSAPPSFVSTMLEDEASLTEDQIRDIKFAASSMYGGGADTTVSAEYAFFLAMVLFPEAMKKAQAEIDAVIGRDRLPTLEDRPHLPYVNAVVLEVMRWNSVAPTGVPHTAMEDGEIGGYFIPKGAMILCNIWGMLHDPEVYPDPFVFKPERHLAEPGKPVERDPRTACFGFGRRICPGMYLAEASLFSAVSTSLAVFDISKAVRGGKPITPEHNNTSGIISYPEQFICSVKPRSDRVVELVADALDRSQ